MLFVFPNDIEIVSRRIEMVHTAGLPTRVTNEVIVIHNSSEKDINEIAMELEEFKRELRILDEDQKALVFLPNKLIRERLPDEKMKKLLDSEDLFIAWIVFPTNKILKAGEYRQLTFSYLESFPRVEMRNKIVAAISIVKPKLFYFDLSFQKNETVSTFLRFENGVTHYSGLIINAMDSMNKKIYDGIDPLTDFHYEEEENYLSMTISGKKREKLGISSITLLYAVQPELVQRLLISGLIWFSIAFPIILNLAYQYNKSLSFFGVGITTELITLFTLGITRLQTKLLSAEKYVIFALGETTLILFITLFPHMFPILWGYIVRLYQIIHSFFL